MKFGELKNSSLIKGLISFLISGGFVILLLNRLQSVDFSTLTLTSVKLPYIFLSILFYVSGQGFRAMAWHHGFDRDLKTHSVFKAITLGNGANMVLPFRMGEALRIGAIRTLYPNKKISNIALYLLSERLMDVVVLALIAVTTAFFLPFSPEIESKVKTIQILILLGGVIGPLFFYGLSKLTSIKPIQRFFALIHTPPFNSLQNWGIILFYMLLSWTMVYGSIWMGIISIGGSGQELLGALLVLIFTNLGMLIPSAPGGIGIFQYATVTALTMTHFTTAESAILAVLLHILQYMALIPLAIYYFLRLGLKGGSSCNNI